MKLEIKKEYFATSNTWYYTVYKDDIFKSLKLTEEEAREVLKTIKADIKNPQESIVIYTEEL